MDFKRRAENLEEFRKAKTHKYFKRVKGKSGKWKYYYTEADYKKATGKKESQKSEAKSGYTEKELKSILKNFNIHTASSVIMYAKDHNYALDKVVSSIRMDGYEKSDASDKAIAAVVSMVKNKEIKIDIDAGKGAEHDIREPMPTKNKQYPWKIEGQIDRQPYVVWMKYPIEFDTSY